MRSGLLIALGVAVLCRSAAADTFLLTSGDRVVGEMAGEIRVEGKPHVRVRTLFGSVTFPKAELKRTLRSERTQGPLRVEQIVVTTLKGDVHKRAPGAEEWKRISPRRRVVGTSDATRSNTPNSILAPGETLRTGKDGEADLDIGWGVVHVAPESELVFVSTEEDASSVRLLKGAAGARMPDLPEGGEFRVETPQATMAVRGTTFVVSSGATFRVAVEEGTVAVGELIVSAGGAVEAAAGTPARGSEILPSERAIFERLKKTFAISRLDRVRVPRGEFDYAPLASGSPRLLLGTGGHEDPTVTRVTVEPFEMARTEVTNAQWRQFEAFMREHGDHAFCHPDETEGYEHASFRDVAHIAGDNHRGEHHPVAAVTFFDAHAFASWVGGRLPSEVEWICAAYGGATARYPWGDDNEQSRRHEHGGRKWRGYHAEGFAWLHTSPASGTTHPVGTKLPNGFGLYDMVGNVSEIVSGIWPEGGRAHPTDGAERPPTWTDFVAQGRGRGAVVISCGGTYATSSRLASPWYVEVSEPEGPPHSTDWPGIRVCW